MAGRAKDLAAKAAGSVSPEPAPAPEPKAPVSVGPANVAPNHVRVLGLSGGEPVLKMAAPAPLTAEQMMHKVIEPGWVPPEMRSNLDYQAKQRAQREEEERNLAKARSAFGRDRTIRIIGASPNMAAGNVNTVF